MHGTVEDIHMPYEYTASEAVREILNTIGNQMASENGLEKHYEGVETYEHVSSAAPIFDTHIDGVYKEDFIALPGQIKAKCANLGIHAAFDADMILGYRSVHYHLMKTERLSEEHKHIPRVTIYTITDKYTVDVNDYGCLPEKITANVDTLENTENVKSLVKNAGAANVVFELLDSFDRYTNLEGSSLDVFELKSENTYEELNSLLSEQVEARQEEIDSSFANYIPGVKQIYHHYAEKSLEKMRASKQEIIDDLQAKFENRE